MADNPNSLFVVPNVFLGKCEHFIDRNPVGNLDAGITDKEETANYRERIVYPQCEKCQFYPSCIKLKCCEPDRVCTDFDVKTMKDEAVRTILYLYEEFLNGKINATVSDEATDC